MIKKFSINYSDKELSIIYNKIRNYPWQSMPNVDHWEYGTSHKYLKELCDYWIKDFKWKTHEELINSFFVLY